MAEQVDQDVGELYDTYYPEGHNNEFLHKVVDYICNYQGRTQDLYRGLELFLIWVREEQSLTTTQITTIEIYIFALKLVELIYE
jgi:hypothetical protein